MGDRLDSLLPSFGKRRWDSVASRCQSSGAALHFLSLSSERHCDAVMASGKEEIKQTRPEGEAGLSLLSITQGSEVQGENLQASILQSRQSLAQHIEKLGKMVSLKLVMKNLLGQIISSYNVLSSEMPLLELSNGSVQTKCKFQRNELHTKTQHHPFLREISLPFNDNLVDSNGFTLPSIFSNSSLSRPLVGLYQWPTFDNNGLVFRPLPAAEHDLKLPPPSLIFQCESLEVADSLVEKVGASTARVGFSGCSRKGQLMVKHENLTGLDIRFCEGKGFSSSFAEAQESLFAGSFDDLQSSDVMSEGKQENNDGIIVSTRSDAMNGLGDCWMEFRSNMKRPSGFFKKYKSSFSSRNDSVVSKLRRVAKAPNIPYK